MLHCKGKHINIETHFYNTKGPFGRNPDSKRNVSDTLGNISLRTESLVRNLCLDSNSKETKRSGTCATTLSAFRAPMNKARNFSVLNLCPTNRLELILVIMVKNRNVSYEQLIVSQFA